MAFFCSEEMELCHLMVHVEAAFNCLMEVGHYGKLQFNNVYDEDHIVNGLYTKRVSLCHELSRIVDYLSSQLKSLNIKEVFYYHVDTDYRPRETDLLKYDVILRKFNEEVSSIMENFTTLETRENFLMEKRYALAKASKLFASDGAGAELLYSESTIALLIKDQSSYEPQGHALKYILGSIRMEKFPTFELLLYRLFGHNVLVRRAEIPQRAMEHSAFHRQYVHKYVVLLMTTASNLRGKLIKVCQAFQVIIFDCPEKLTERQKMIEELDADIKDIKLIQQQSVSMHENLLHVIANELYIMRINLRKCNKVYDLMNRLYLIGGTERRRFLQAECFTPKIHFENVRQALLAGMHDQENLVAPPLLTKRRRKQRHIPPTYFELNKFTQGFQNLIDAYGMADYRELNPAPYTIITFPFLFAIMFGDLGHGIILTFLSCLLIFQEKRIEQLNRTTISENEILNILYAGRYIVLLMGIFSMYVGLIYNDVVSVPLNIFGSSWSSSFNTSTIRGLSKELELDPSNSRMFSGHPYPFGVDPMWLISGEDSINTFNSLKMKLAIVLGVTQMMFGLCLAAANCIHLGRKADLLLVVLPLFVFMIALFCYLVFLIIFKWITYGGLNKHPYNAGCAPSVLLTFIDMMLMKSTVLEDKTCNKGMFPFEREIEYGLVFVAFLSVPILFAAKPLYLTRRQKRLSKKHEKKAVDDRGSNSTIEEMRSSLRYSVDIQEQDRGSRSTIPKLETVDDAVEFDMSEIWIHSAIHTIESVLGSVSHTASYLRLWALSLAHCQLAHVLWEMVLQKGLKHKLPIYFGAPLLVAVFFMWALLTVAILVMMEGLSAFLHTLRLHWVEFQSKFFSGSGEPFRSFYFPPSTIRG